MAVYSQNDACVFSKSRQSNPSQWYQSTSARNWFSPSTIKTNIVGQAPTEYLQTDIRLPVCHLIDNADNRNRMPSLVAETSISSESSVLWGNQIGSVSKKVNQMEYSKISSISKKINLKLVIKIWLFHLIYITAQNLFLTAILAISRRLLYRGSSFLNVQLN